MKAAQAGEIPVGSALEIVAGTGDIVSCPFHGWMFKLDSGQCVKHPGAAAKTYRTRVNGTDIEVFLPVSG